MEKRTRSGEILSKVEVEKFITRVWEHPLLNEETKYSRDEALHFMQENMEAVGYKSKDYIALPCGSLLWSIGPASDYDFVLIDLTRSFLSSDDEAENESFAAEITPVHEEIHILRIRDSEIFPTQPFSDPVAYQLLFTPDEYIVGNLEVAAELRLKILKRLDHTGKGAKLWDKTSLWNDHSSEANLIFDSYFRYWDKSPFGSIEVEKSKLEGPSIKRRERFRERLEERALQSRNPEVWRKQFLHARSAFKIPSYDSYLSYLQNTKGRLHLNPKYKSQGIKSNF